MSPSEPCVCLGPATGPRALPVRQTGGFHLHDFDLCEVNASPFVRPGFHVLSLPGNLECYSGTLEFLLTGLRQESRKIIHCVNLNPGHPSPGLHSLARHWDRQRVSSGSWLCHPCHAPSTFEQCHPLLLRSSPGGADTQTLPCLEPTASPM